ncbi:Transcription factor BIM1, putative isoform 2 [Hibiscus syriacus]|uniref:Transcription factor BIM1, putative isoform 2 n=1 Tax=Hibiscus syriacus TaxID=106335 RepID=A0A6A3CEC0_HIBSY|nr:Transcription factor BIM1, putative isoform 2 [Hibiscus syriacus]
MELPQSRPFGAEGRKPAHDFLSLYSHSSIQQDPRPPSQGAYLKTRDFLQLEQQGNQSARKGTTVEVAGDEKPPPPPVERILPGGIGTYSISHISCFNPRVPKAEGTVFTVAEGSSKERNDENSNCSSYTGSGFTLWEESAGKRGKTRKENAEETSFIREAAGRVGQWDTTSLEKGSQSSTNNHPKSFSCLSSSQQSSNQKRQSFMEMLKSAKDNSLDDDFEEDEDFVLKKDNSTSTHNIGELRVKVDGKSAPDQKANTPRFQMLRNVIPNSDQKRDKASFLLEVIKYIQFLQEKVNKYDGSYQGWSSAPSNSIPWRSNKRPTENYADQSRAINGMPAPSLVFPAKLDEGNNTVTLTMLESAENPIKPPNTSRATTTTTFRAMDLSPGMMNKTIPFPVSLQPNFFNSAHNTVPATQIAPRLPSYAENSAFQPQTILCHNGSCTTDGSLPNEKPKEQEPTIEGGMISISSVYSHRLLNTLTQALQTSGLDLSRASISVQIELGKRSNSQLTAPTSTHKDTAAPSVNPGKTRPRVGYCEDSEQPLKKKLKI